MRHSWFKDFWESLVAFAETLWQEVFPSAPEVPRREEEEDRTTAGL